MMATAADLICNGHGSVFDENFLMAIATIGAFAIGEYREAIFVMVFYQTGELLQSITLANSRKSISSLLDIRPDFANLVSENGISKVDPDKVQVGDIIHVKPGEKIPLDGIVIEGNSYLDVSALTGESLPAEVGENQGVLSGSINTSGLLKIRVTKPFGESTVSKILELTENASTKKTKTERFITRFSKIYTPIVCALALVVATVPPLILGFDVFTSWLNRALIFLVVSCPCALVISVPLGYFGGIGGSSKNGILVKGSTHLDVLSKVDTIVFDKTGTLTKGNFKICQVAPFGEFTKENLLKTAAIAESQSNHPIAKAIVAGCDDFSADGYTFTEESGRGMIATSENTTILCGNHKLLAEHGISAESSEDESTQVFVAINGEYMGSLSIADEIKEDSFGAISQLKKQHIKTAMLTGDKKSTADRVREKLGIDFCLSELLPADKVENFESIPHEGSIVFVGDGINDAPVLARADVGIAMGGVGSDAAIEAADVVIMNDSLSKIPLAIRIAKKTKRIIKQNIVFSLTIKGLVLLLAPFNLVSMWLAIFADVGVAILATLNATRTLRIK